MPRTSLPLSATLFLLTAVLTAQAPTKIEDLKLEALFPRDRLLAVEITVAKQDWKELRMQSRTFQSALSSKRKRGEFQNPYSYFDAVVSIDGTNLGSVGVRKKGFIGSLSTTRPSLKIKLNHSDRTRNIEGLTNLTFNNNQQDESLASQLLCYGLFHAAGLPAPRCAYARVTVNGKYLGIYSHIESMRPPLLERGFGAADGVLYEGTVADFFEGWAAGFEHKRGDDSHGRKRIEQLIEVLSTSSDESLEAAVAELVDLDAFFRFWALEGLTGFWDGYSGNKNNYYLYLHPKTDRFHFLPWGADMVFLRYNPLERDLEAPLSVKTSGRLAYRLYQLESGRRRYEAAMRSLLAEHWDEKAILAECDRLEALLEPHLGRSQRRAIDKLYELREFVEGRRAEILAEIDGGMPIWDKRPSPPFVIPDGDAEWEDTIWRAARDGDLAALRRHLEAGVDVNTTSDEDGSHPLALAAVAGRAEAVRYLIGKGAVVDAKNQRGETALHGAAFLGHVEVVRALIDAGADLDLETNDGSTPLDNATVEWSDETAGIVSFLGTVLGIEFDTEQIKANRPKAAALLQKHGARSPR